jgi:hypothetical protein
MGVEVDLLLSGLLGGLSMRGRLHNHTSQAEMTSSNSTSEVRSAS